MVDDGERFFFQPCFSPVWDTAIGAYALGEAGDRQPPSSLQRAADWLLTSEIRRKGDWSVKRPDTEPSGWAFEFRNDWYPDIDDTAMVMLALPHVRGIRSDGAEGCEERGLDWLLAMQSKDGGWAAFDVDNNWEILSHVPFADHNAMLDPTCADITGRTLEALAATAFDRNHPAVQRGIDYLIRTQEADGSWYGRWGVAYIYGTCFALRGLRGHGRGRSRAAHPARQRMAALDPECRRRLGRKLRQLRQRHLHARREHAVADRLGADGPDGRRRHLQLQRAARHRVPAEDAARGRQWHEELATGTGFPRSSI